MFALNREVQETVTGVSSLQNLAREEHDHLDVRSLVNVHATILLDRRVVIWIFEGEGVISHGEHDHDHMAIWTFSYHPALETSPCLSCHRLSGENTVEGGFWRGVEI
jgi:hypothetical protein